MPEGRTVGADFDCNAKVKKTEPERAMVRQMVALVEMDLWSNKIDVCLRHCIKLPHTIATIKFTSNAES